ncbi:hypothetical protein [Kamptonema sp. UHCC 0994]|uniref:hypothetical protein n=1 Tax=Kamptonema sp. UHCC 0994 TaxID=3031329 RepID=UPI0023B9AEFC|nr:hypothetical protein [Kamptonema sp. UHCC 0994]MDF0554700.1 hypothetical protein [Kamptonema sp. UHCC 0994]
MTRTLYKKNYTFQRHSESPILSMAALFGSVVLHAVAFCSIRLGAVDSMNTVQKEPVSVELIEIDPIVESRKPVSPVVINSKISPSITSKGTIPDAQVIANAQKKVAVKPVAVRSPSKPVPKPTVAVKPVAVRSPSKPLPKPTVAVKPVAVRSPSKPLPKPTVTPKPVVKRSPSKPVPKPTVTPKPVVVRSPSTPVPKTTVAVKPVVVRSPSTPVPKPTVTPKPVVKRSPSTPVPKPTVTPKPVVKRSPSTPVPKPTVTPKPVVKRSRPVRAIPYPPGTLGDRKPVMPTPPTPSPKPQPSGSQNNGSVLATFDLGSIRSGDRDIPDRLAKPVQNQRQFSPVLNPLEIGLSSGSALTLEVLVEIDEKGKLTIVREVNAVEDGTKGSSEPKNTDYLGFAKELLKNWEFQAAHSGGQAVYSELWLRLTVKAL